MANLPCGRMRCPWCKLGLDHYDPEEARIVTNELSKLVSAGFYRPRFKRFLEVLADWLQQECQTPPSSLQATESAGAVLPPPVMTTTTGSGVLDSCFVRRAAEGTQSTKEVADTDNSATCASPPAQRATTTRATSPAYVLCGSGRAMSLACPDDAMLLRAARPSTPPGLQRPPGLSLRTGLPAADVSLSVQRLGTSSGEMHGEPAGLASCLAVTPPAAP